MESYLVHYGIKGMKWGVRRYQNEDNTLTEEGKIRYRANPVFHPIRSVHEAISSKARDARIAKAQKQIADKGLTDRFTEKELNKYSQISNGSYKKMILNKMTKYKNMTYSGAYASSLIQSLGTSIVLLTVYNKALKNKKAQNFIYKMMTKKYKI